MGHKLRSCLVALAFGLAIMRAQGASAQQAPHCAQGEKPQFVLGFADLKAQVGDPMGSPVECEHAEFSLTIGDRTFDRVTSVQRTSSGAAFYRDSTRTATFFDGSAGWDLSPRGLSAWWVEPPIEWAVVVYGPGGYPAPECPQFPGRYQGGFTCNPHVGPQRLAGGDYTLTFTAIAVDRFVCHMDSAQLVGPEARVLIPPFVLDRVSTPEEDRITFEIPAGGLADGSYTPLIPQTACLWTLTLAHLPPGQQATVPIDEPDGAVEGTLANA